MCQGVNGQILADLRSRLVFLITSKRIELQTWGWSSFEDFSEEIMKTDKFEARIPRGLHKRVPKEGKWQLSSITAISCYICFSCTHISYLRAE